MRLDNDERTQYMCINYWNISQVIILIFKVDMNEINWNENNGNKVE